VKKAEGLLKEAEQKKSTLVREAEELKAEAIREARRTVEEGKRELEVLVRRREDINAEISRVQDVLEALESFEAPAGSKDGGVKAGAAIGAPRSGGKPSDG
jgi:F0F1-type ATP synthase membrane subunit b/b'